MAFEIIQGFNLSKNGPLDLRLISIDEDAMIAHKWVHKGIATIRLDTSPLSIWICTATAATQPGAPNYTEVADWEEFTGTAGADGADGSQIFTGTGVPSDALGANGDFYLDNATGNYYTKAAGTWGAAQGSLKGVTGDDGANGIDGAGAPVYGQIATHEGVGTQTVASGVPELLTQFILDGISSSGVTPTAASDKIVLTEAGIYIVEVDLSFSGANSSTWVISAYANVDSAGAAEIPGGHIERKLGSGGDVGAASFTTLISVAEGTSVDIEVWIEGDGANAFVLKYGNLTVTALGAKGDDGADGGEGKALIHTEFDITLTAAKILNVEGGTPHTATIYNPYSASILFDGRDSVERNATAGIIGVMTANSISYDGTSWYNNGRWLGHSGLQGEQGETGADSIVPGPPGDDGAGVLAVDASWVPQSDLNFEVVSPFDHTAGDIYNKRIILDTVSSSVSTFDIIFPNTVSALDGLRKVTLAIDNTVKQINLECKLPGSGYFYNGFTGTKTRTLSLKEYMVDNFGTFTFTPFIKSGIVHYHVIGGVRASESYEATNSIVWNRVVNDTGFYTNGSHLYSNFHHPTKAGNTLVDIAWQHWKGSTVGTNAYVAIQTYNSAESVLISTDTYYVDIEGVSIKPTNGTRQHMSIVKSLDITKSYVVHVFASRPFGQTIANDVLMGTDAFGVTYIK